MPFDKPVEADRSNNGADSSLALYNSISPGDWEKFSSSRKSSEPQVAEVVTRKSLRDIVDALIRQGKGNERPND